MARITRNKYGSIITNAGDTITKSMQKEYLSLVKSLNASNRYYVNKMYSSNKDSDLLKGITLEEYKKTLEHHGFMQETYSTSLSRFTSRREFMREVRDLKKIKKDKNYNTRKIEDTRDVMLRQLDFNFGRDAKELKNVIKNLSAKELTMFYMFTSGEIIRLIFDSDQDFDSNEFLEESKSKIELGVSKIYNTSLAKSKIKALKQNHVKTKRRK